MPISVTQLFALALAGLLVGCSAEEAVAPPEAILSVALHVSGDPGTLVRQNIQVYRAELPFAVRAITFPLEPNDSARVSVPAPASYRVVRPSESANNVFGERSGFARNWCQQTTSSTPQPVFAVPGGNFAVGLFYDCPPADGTGTLKVSVTTTGAGALESSFELVITRTGPGPAPPTYSTSRTVPSNGVLDLELPRGVYGVHLIETPHCRVQGGEIGPTPDLIWNNPASVMLHPDGVTYVLQGRTQSSWLVNFPVVCQ